MNKTKFAILLAASLGLASCGSSTEKNEGTTQDTSKTELKNDAAGGSDAADTEVNGTETNEGDEKIEGTGEVKKLEPVKEDPSKIEVKKEDPKKIVVTPEDPKKLRVN
jgi:2',3'-cyclic-nucleotide 2'-phosphodiesterase / 3'-nucleotidase